MLLKQLNPDAFEILLFLGFCPSGMLEEDIDKIWEKGWSHNKTALVQQNIISIKLFGNKEDQYLV